MLRKPKIFKKYHEAELTLGEFVGGFEKAATETYQEAFNELRDSQPRCNIGLKRYVRGNGTFVVRKPENAQLIQLPITIMGTMFKALLFNISDAIEGSGR